jgi:hypothetical protein
LVPNWPSGTHAAQRSRVRKIVTMRDRLSAIVSHGARACHGRRGGIASGCTSGRMGLVSANCDLHTYDGPGARM